MKKPKKSKAPLISDVTTRYQVSRSLPDLRDGPISPATGTVGFGPPGRSAKNRSNTIGFPQDDANSKKDKHKDKKKRSWKKIVKRFFLFLLIIILAVGGWLGYKAYKDSGKLGTNLFSIFNNAKLKGEDTGHVNILLAGDSADDPGHAGADLTDSIMVLSVNTVNHTAFLLSIPRDLYVNIPNNGYSKINATYEYGQQQNFSAPGYPNGGMGLLEQVVSQKLNMPIDYYALINYTAFRDAVNAVGGVTVTIGNSPYGVYDPYAGLKLASGTQQINGTQALALARARGDGPGAYGVTSDFDRTMEQRLMLLSLKDKASSVGVLSNPVKVGNLFDAAGNNVKTDLSLGNIRRLNTLTKNIPDADIASASLNSANFNGQTKVNLLRNYETEDGESALIPAAGLNDYNDIQAYVQSLLNATSTTSTTQK